MDNIERCLQILRKHDVDVDSAVGRLMGRERLYLDFVKRLPQELKLEATRDALARQDEEEFHFYLHGLKAFASNLGITEIADTAQAGLVEFRVSKFRNVAKLESLLDDIEASGEKFASALKKIEVLEQIAQATEKTT